MLKKRCFAMKHAYFSDSSNAFKSDFSMQLIMSSSKIDISRSLSKMSLLFFMTVEFDVVEFEDAAAC